VYCAGVKYGEEGLIVGGGEQRDIQETPVVINLCECKRVLSASLFNST